MPQDTQTNSPLRFGPSSLISGLSAEYFVVPRATSRLSEIDFTAAPAAIAVVDGLDLVSSDRPFWQGGATDYFAARYTGSLQVETAGRYTLYLTSDDGSALYLDGVKVIDNDGVHAKAVGSVTLDLDARAHALEVRYFESSGNQTLQLEWDGPESGGVRKIVSGNALVHDAEPVAQILPAAQMLKTVTQLSVAGRSYDLVDQAAAQQGTAVHKLSADGSAVTLTDNGWKGIKGSFNVAADTVMTFKFSAKVIGEIHGIGFANGDSLQASTFFQLAGTQSWGLKGGGWEYVPGSGEVLVRIEVGKYFTGSFDRLVLGMDDDRNVGADSTFAKIDIGPAPPQPVTQLSVAGRSYDLVDQAAAQQGTAVHKLSADGSAVTLTDNGWKGIKGSFNVAADTVMTFKFSAKVIGEIHGIGFANGDSFQASTFFQLAGTQSWGLKGGGWEYVPGSGEVLVRIEVGKYFTGSFDRLVLGMDDDMHVGADSTFAKIDIGPAPPKPVNSPPKAVDDNFATGHDAALAFLAADLLANDNDANGDALSLTGVKALTGGSVTRTGDAILFTPDKGFHGTAKFVYSVSDGVAVSTATVSINVSAAGYANNLLASVSEGVGLADPSLAVGLDGFSYWTSPPFLNLMKQAGGTGIRNSAGEKVPFVDLVKQGYLDANGYPVKMYPGNELLPLWQQGYEITVSIHHPNDFVRQETSGDYVVEWSGAGDIQLYGFGVTSRQTIHTADGAVAGGRMTGTWGYEDVLKMVKILTTDPQGTGNYIHDISIVRAEYKDMYDAGAIFDPRYMALIEDHQTLRFMDWMKTNGSDVKSLADVASMDSLTWAGDVNTGDTPEVSRTGVLPLPAQVPFEVMVQLANEVGADPWFNIPLKADDDYVRALAAYVNDHLDDGLVAKFELSNEVWNWAWGFEQVREASLLGSDGASSTNIRAAREYYGYRSAEIKAILDAEITHVDTQMILATQTVYFEITKMVEGGVSRYFADQGTVGQMSDVFDALGVTGYFGEVNSDEFAKLRQFWYTESQAAFAAGNTGTKYDVFVARAADYLANGIDTLTSQERALVTRQPDGKFNPSLIDPLEGNLRNNFAENKRMAENWGLELIQYEADSHISAKTFRGDPEAEWYKALNKSPEMGALTARMAEIFREEGGTLVNDFGQLSESSYGLWGTRAHIADENPISAAYDTYNKTAAALFGSINAGRDPTAFLQGMVKNGTKGADELIGTEQRDYLIGGEGNDLLVGGAGDDGLHGGAGIDMALFAGRRDEFVFRTDGDVLIVSGPTGEDRLVDVELLAFAGSRDFVRASDLTGDTPLANLPDLLAQFDTQHGLLAQFF